MDEFTAFPKMARFKRDVVITEKLDGTNAQIHIKPMDPTFGDDPHVLGAIRDDQGHPCLMVKAASRTRYITPDQDNAGFARWVVEHLQELRSLGVGRHYGEWWGQGIQRGYGLSERRFSLFNAQRWVRFGTEPARLPNPNPKATPKYQEVAPDCCHVVPVVYQGLFGTSYVDFLLHELEATGSQAAPGFMQPEGLVVFHTAANVGFKITLEDDGQPKGGWVAG